MSIWQILDIASTNDIAAIKKAYSKKLKQHHPEDDPAGYQRLREAYDTAIKLASRQAKQKAVPELDDPAPLTIPEHPEPFQPLQPIRPIQPVRPTPDIHEQTEQLIEKAVAIYSDFQARIDLNRWTELLNSDALWDIRHKQIVGRRFYHFLQEHRLLPKNVWLLIESCFHWKADLDDSEPDAFMKEYLRQLDGPELRYNYIPSGMDIESIDRFLSRRAAAFQALQDNQLDMARTYAEEALDVFLDDPDLLRIQGELLVHSGELDDALDVYSRIVRLSPSELDGYIGRVRILFGKGLYHEAIEACDNALALAPDHEELQFLLASCYRDLGEISKAIAIFERLKPSYHYARESRINLLELRGQLRTSTTTLTPARRYRLRPGEGSVLFLFFVLSFIIMFSELFGFGNMYQKPIVISAPHELLQPDLIGHNVRVELTGIDRSELNVDDGRIKNLIIPVGNSDQTMDFSDTRYRRISVGYSGDSLVMAASWLLKGHPLENGDHIVTGVLSPLVLTESDADSITRQFGSEQLIREVYIDTTRSGPRSNWFLPMLPLRLLSLFYMIWYTFRFLRKIYRLISGG